MGLRDWLLRIGGGGPGEVPPLPPRRVRREAARWDHRLDDDAPAWAAEDRHENPDPGRPVSDLAPGTPGSGAGRRWLGRRRH